MGFFLLFLLNILLITIFSFETCEYSVSCQEDLEAYCATKEKSDSSNVFYLSLRKCIISQRNFCDIYDTLISSTERRASCQYLPYILASYTGGMCSLKLNQFDFECIYGKCINGICVNDYDGNCNGHEDCPLNQACINDKCQEYKKESESCHNSYECEYNLICVEEHCAKQYSFEGEIKDIFNITDLPEALCKSGMYYKKIINDREEYHCGYLKNINDECREDCQYINEKDEIIHIEENCICGYNKERSKHCKLGTGENDYIEFIKMKKDFINNPEYTKYCHTLERKDDDICIELLKINRKVSFRTFVQQYNNVKIKALEYARLRNSDSCVKEVMFNYDIEPIIPDKMSCSKVKCDYTIPTCMEGHNPFNEEGDGIEVKVNDKICNENELCYVDNIKYTLAPIYRNKELKGECKPKIDKGIKRYPGEDCNETTQCFSGFCINKKCTGISLNQNCEKDEECLVGLYCDKEKKSCLAQKREKERCLTSWECLNYLGCYKGFCQKFGTLPLSPPISEEDVPFPGTTYKGYYMCEYGTSDRREKICADRDYAGETLKKLQPGEDFVKCEKSEKCNYTDGVQEYGISCGCGYNEEGQGYCKLATTKRKDKWKQRINILAELTNNQCHTLSRFECYLILTPENQRIVRLIASETQEAALYYNAVPCAYNVFNSSFHLGKNILILLLGMVFILH